MRLAQSTTDPVATANYLKMAEDYLVVSEAELKLAMELEQLQSTLKAN